MTYSTLLRVVGALLVATTAFSAPEAATPPLRFSTDHMDRTADPRKDFARFAYGHWQDTNPVPVDKSRWGALAELAQENQKSLRSIAEAAAAKPHEPGSVEQKVGDFYRSAMDTATIEAAGLQPIAVDLARIQAITTSEDLARELAALHDAGVGGLFTVGVRADSKRSDHNALHASQGGLSLPSRDYYFADQFAAIRTAYLEHLTTMFALAGDTQETAAAAARTVYDLELLLADKSRTPTQLRDRIANYHKVATNDFMATVAAFPFPVYFGARGIGGPAAAEIIVGQPEFFASLQVALTAQPLTAWKTYLRYQLLRASAPHLASAFEQENFRFYDTVVAGTPAQEPRWQKSVKVIDGQIGEALGQLYVAQHYPPEARARMAEMISRITEVMRDRLATLEWMSEPTRQKALAKFTRYVSKIGNPDSWLDYRTVEIKPDAYFANYRAGRTFNIRRQLAKLGQPVDPTEWSMTPPTVNAYFSPTDNTINFPAGILQPPFFDVTQDDAVNYGAIGAVIGHEITHGFDDQGRRYNADGNLADWWTEEDATRFTERAAKVVAQYNSYEALPGLHVNGLLTLGENIADLGGVSIAFEALQRSLDGKPRVLVDGLTPEQRFFLAWAQAWRTNIRDAALRRQVATDSHSPGNFRAVGPLMNLQAFFDAFGIQAGDPMWRAPEERAKIW